MTETCDKSLASIIDTALFFSVETCRENGDRVLPYTPKLHADVLRSKKHAGKQIG